MLHNTLDESVFGADYTVNLEGHDDDKKNVFWTGKAADGQWGKVIAEPAD